MILSAQPGTVTLTGSYTVTRPLMSSTVTVCNAWFVPFKTARWSDTQPNKKTNIHCSTAGPTAPVPVGTGSPKPWTSPAPGAAGTTTAVAPAFTGGASHVAARAGAGLAAVFGAAAFLL